MYFDDYEEYYEPTLADEILLEYQNKMKDVLLETIKNDINSIKEENQRLKDENKSLREREREVSNREQKLEYEKSNLMRRVRKERLSELMKDFQVTLYRAYTISEKLPKCDKCDENRKVQFVSPLGKSMEESCSCNVSKKVYIPLEHICTEFKLDRDGKRLAAWYKEHHERGYDWYSYSSNYAETVYDNGMKYDDLDSYRTYFKSKEECQKYCDWLNEKNKESVVFNSSKAKKSK